MNVKAIYNKRKQEEDQLKKIFVQRMIIKGKSMNTYRRTESIILILLMWYIIV